MFKIGFEEFQYSKCRFEIPFKKAFKSRLWLYLLSNLFCFLSILKEWHQEFWGSFPDVLVLFLLISERIDVFIKLSEFYDDSSRAYPPWNRQICQIVKAFVNLCLKKHRKLQLKNEQLSIDNVNLREWV